MSVEANKKLVLNFFENFSAGKAKAFLAQMDDNATWEAMGKKESFPLAGKMTKAEFVESIKQNAAKLPKGIILTPKTVTTEEDRVAVEAESYGEPVDGKIYNHLYHFLIEVRDGTIQAVREYMDTLHMKERLLG